MRDHPTRDRVLSFALFVAGIALAGLALLVGLVWWQQERIVFQPPGAAVDVAGYPATSAAIPGGWNTMRSCFHHTRPTRSTRPARAIPATKRANDSTRSRVGWSLIELSLQSEPRMNADNYG